MIWDTFNPSEGIFDNWDLINYRHVANIQAAKRFPNIVISNSSNQKYKTPPRSWEVGFFCHHMLSLWLRLKQRSLDKIFLDILNPTCQGHCKKDLKKKIKQIFAQKNVQWIRSRRVKPDFKENIPCIFKIYNLRIFYNRLLKSVCLAVFTIHL